MQRALVFDPSNILIQKADVKLLGKVVDHVLCAIKSLDIYGYQKSGGPRGM